MTGKKEPGTVNICALDKSCWVRVSILKKLMKLSEISSLGLQLSFKFCNTGKGLNACIASNTGKVVIDV